MSGTQGGQHRAVRGINDFADVLIEAIRSEQATGSRGTLSTNFVCSPLSVATALAIVMLGASGATRQELIRLVAGDTTDEAEDASSFHSSMQVLSNSLAERNHPPARGSRPLDDDPWAESREVELTIGNALWGERATDWLPQFVASTAERYGASLNEVAFADDPELVRRTVNRWVADVTNGRITDLLERGAVDHLTRLVVVNAVYFKANWQWAFGRGATRQASFITDRGPVEVPMMHQTEYLSYAIGSDWQAVELPYVFGELSLLVVMSRQRTDRQLVAAPSGDDRVDHLPPLDEVDATMTSGRVDLMFPCFDIRTAASLREMLAQLGLHTTFSDTADLSAMTTDETVGISDVFHYAAISVDEHGTEATAATALPAPGGVAPLEDPIELRFNRPFRFWLRDVPTGVIVFAGYVGDPSQSTGGRQPTDL